MIKQFKTALIAVAALAGLMMVMFGPAGAPEYRASAATNGQIAAMLQGSFADGNQCSNNWTFCRADVSRCQRIERERQNWRTQCLARHKARYDECVSERAPLRGHFGAKFEGVDPRCAHLANYQETKCQVEAQICPVMDRCQQEYRQCVREYSASVGQQGRILRDEQARARDPYRESPQQNISSPNTRSSTNSAKGGVNLERAAASMARTQAKQAAREQTRERALRYAQIGSMAGLDGLLDDGLNPVFSDRDGNTLLHAAVMPYPSVSYANAPMVERLVALGVDADRRNRSGKTPLALALDKRIKDKKYHQSDRLAKPSPFKNRILNAIVDGSQVLPKKSGEGGLTLLHVAALDYDALLIQKLLKRKFPSGLVDDRGRTAYEIASAKSPALAALFPEHADAAGEEGAAGVKRASECSDLSIVPQNQHQRYKQLAEQGILKLCDAQ